MINEQEKKKVTKIYAVTGTHHGSIVIAETEGQARRVFHKFYNGESITHVRTINSIPW